MAAPAPLPLFRAVHKWMGKPVRVDAKRNQLVFDAKGYEALMTRLRNCIEHLEKQDGP